MRQTKQVKVKWGFGVIFFEVYKGYYNKNNLLGGVIPLAETNPPFLLKEYIKPSLLNFFKYKKIDEGFFVITIKYEKKTFIIDCELKNRMIAKMEIHF